jgi:hypothetical protein
MDTLFNIYKVSPFSIIKLNVPDTLFYNIDLHLDLKIDSVLSNKNEKKNNKLIELNEIRLDRYVKSVSPLLEDELLDEQMLFTRLISISSSTRSSSDGIICTEQSILLKNNNTIFIKELKEVESHIISKINLNDNFTSYQNVPLKISEITYTSTTTNPYSSVNDINSEIWTTKSEKMLKVWANKAECYKIMHEKANKKYYCLNIWFNIPSIIITTIIGSGSFAVSNDNNSNKSNFLVIIGCMNIFATILTAIVNFMNFGKKMEAHKNAAIEWNKFCRKIIIELDKIRPHRINVNKFVLQLNNEYDHLFEYYPSIPNDIIKWFHLSFNNFKLNNIKYGFVECINENLCFPFGCNIDLFSNKFINDQSCLCPICMESKTYMNSLPYEMV